jgi:hypothetical protein
MLRCHLGFPTCGGEFHRHSVIERENPWVIPGCSHQTLKGLFNPLKGLFNTLKGLFNPLKGLFNPLKGLFNPLYIYISGNNMDH